MQELSCWKDFHEFWLAEAAKEDGVPVHFIRFEDLTADPLTVLSGVFEHVLEVESLEGT